MADETKLAVIEEVEPKQLETEKKIEEKATANGKEKIANGTSNENGKENENEAKDEESLKKEANQLFLQGKRHLLIRDYTSAVASLADSCHLLSSIYDEQADEMGDPYFYYGKALFELARNESDVLGDQVERDAAAGDDESDDDEDEDEAEEQGEETKDADKAATSNNVEKNEHPAETKEGEQQNEEQTEQEAQEEINDLQLSWEYFELAKLIYLRKAGTCKETAIKLSEVYLYLGENGLESESYGTAIEDIKECLKLQKENLPEDDRRIAETYYQLGMANSLYENFDEAISCFKSAIEQLEKKVTSLGRRKDSGDQKTDDEAKDAFYTMEGEIDEIKKVIGDIRDKITDMHDYKNQMKAELLKQVVSAGSKDGASSSSSTAQPEAGSSSSSASSAAKPVTDISHLVRKKRKNENESESETPSQEKKTKTEE